MNNVIIAAEFSRLGN